MIDTLTEQLRLLIKASAEIPGRPHISTIIRWWRRGVRGVRLETVVVGGRRFTSLEAITRFIARLSDLDAAQTPPVAQQRQKEVTKAEQRLDAEGIR
jgi:hypothetical protein